jgi:hypothetical protein
MRPRRFHRSSAHVDNELADAIGKADVAIVFDYPSAWAWEIQPQGREFDYFRLVFEILPHHAAAGSFHRHRPGKRTKPRGLRTGHDSGPVHLDARADRGGPCAITDMC